MGQPVLGYRRRDTLNRHALQPIAAMVGFLDSMNTFGGRTRKNDLAGPLLMLLSACGFTVMNVLLKQSMADFGVWDIGFFRFFGGLILLLAVFGRQRNPFRSPNTKLLLTRGCTGSIAFIFFIFSVRRLPVSTALMLLYAYPSFAALFSSWLYQEKVSRLAWLCMATVLAGVAVLVDPAGGADGFGTIAGLLAAAFAGLTMAIIRRLKETDGSVIIYLYFCVVGSIATAPAFLFSPTVPATPSQVMVCAGIVVSSVLGQLTMNHGLGYCRSWEGGLYLTSEVILTSLAGIALLGDPVSWRFFVGGALILGSAVILQLEQTLRGSSFSPHMNLREGA
jgi:drug/metabolite transporter (DMT)-like permease